MVEVAVEAQAVAEAAEVAAGMVVADAVAVADAGFRRRGWQRPLLEFRSNLAHTASVQKLCADG